MNYKGNDGEARNIPNSLLSYKSSMTTRGNSGHPPTISRARGELLLCQFLANIGYVRLRSNSQVQEELSWLARYRYDCKRLFNTRH